VISELTKFNDMNISAKQEPLLHHHLMGDFKVLLRIILMRLTGCGTW